MEKEKWTFSTLPKPISLKLSETTTWVLSKKQCKLSSKQLQEEEKEAIENVDLEKAESASLQIKEMREKEILLKNFLKIEQNQKEFEELKVSNEEQINDFNHKWEGIIEELEDYSRKIEAAMAEQHQQEREQLESELRGTE